MNLRSLKYQVEELVKLKNKVAKIAPHQRQLISDCVDAMQKLEIDFAVNGTKKQLFNIKLEAWIIAAFVAGVVTGKILQV